MATRQLSASGQQFLRIAGVPVFGYHGLAESGRAKLPWRERKYWISPGQFREHLGCIEKEGFQPVLLTELWHPAGRAGDAGHTLVLTFDDGHRSDYERAYPILLERGMRAEFFVNTAMIGEPGHLKWPQILEMRRAGMSFQSHSHEHIDLTRLSALKLAHQLARSKQILEDRLGTPVGFLAVPYGLLDARVLEAALELGYRAVCTSFAWPARAGARIVGRIAVYPRTNASSFRRFLTGQFLCYGPRLARSAVMYVPKRILQFFWQPQIGQTMVEDAV